MKKWIAGVVLLVAALQAWQQYQGAGEDQALAPAATRQDAAPSAAPSGEAASVIAAAFREQRSNVQVQGAGSVSRILADDREGAAHQRFIVRLASGQTVLIAHNIDLASRVAGLREGDAIEFFGEYEWNAQGGVVHWTHRDPDGRHVSGWLRHQGRTYQ
ncbi:MAG: DUF3465 domain-containing protein [Polyangiaceae bacterium]